MLQQLAASWHTRLHEMCNSRGTSSQNATLRPPPGTPFSLSNLRTDESSDAQDLHLVAGCIMISDRLVLHSCHVCRRPAHLGLLEHCGVVLGCLAELPLPLHDDSRCVIVVTHAAHMQRHGQYDLPHHGCHSFAGPVLTHDVQEARCKKVAEQQPESCYDLDDDQRNILRPNRLLRGPLFMIPKEQHRTHVSIVLHWGGMMLSSLLQAIQAI
ncbi:hypothetical protein COO60DRAFT_1482678 [Scenedesmus sp. NREL 46B-D3]|nr:hypothetical protein COO60DRAFT_1482678 [Scenedesmus sp. NREL 46B-D3]